MLSEVRITDRTTKSRRNGTYPDLFAALEVDEDVAESGWPLIIKKLATLVKGWLGCEQELKQEKRKARFQRVQRQNNTFEGLATRSAARFGSQSLPRGRYPFVKSGTKISSLSQLFCLAKDSSVMFFIKAIVA